MCWVEVPDIHLHRKVPEFDKQYSRHPPEHCVITWKTDSWVFTLTHVTLCIHISRFGLNLDTIKLLDTMTHNTIGLIHG